MPPACLTSVIWVSLQKVILNDSTGYKIKQLIPVLFGRWFRLSLAHHAQPFTTGEQCPLGHAEVNSRDSGLAKLAARSPDKQVSYEREPFKVHHSVFQKLPANQTCYVSTSFIFVDCDIIAGIGCS